MELTAMSMFSGIGGAMVGLRQAGFKAALSIEYDRLITGIYRRNLPESKFLVADVLEVSSADLGGPIDLLQASPPCCNFSGAKVGGMELGRDRELALSIARVAEATKPRWVIVENVCAYEKSDSFKELCRKLAAQYPYCTILKLNASDFCWQDRRRMFAIYSKTELPPIEQLLKVRPMRYPDLAYYLYHPTTLTSAQLKVLSKLDPSEHKPSGIIQRAGYRKKPIYRGIFQPMPTNRSHQWHDGKGSLRQGSTLVFRGQAYKMPLQLLAEFSGFPPTFQPTARPIPNKAELIASYVGMGNIVHPPVMAAIARWLNLSI